MLFCSSRGERKDRKISAPCKNPQVPGQGDVDPLVTSDPELVSESISEAEIMTCPNELIECSYVEPLQRAPSTTTEIMASTQPPDPQCGEDNLQVLGDVDPPGIFDADSVPEPITQSAVSISTGKMTSTQPSDPQWEENNPQVPGKSDVDPIGTFDAQSVPETITTPEAEIIARSAESIECVDGESLQRAASNSTGIMTPTQPCDPQSEENFPQLLGQGDVGPPGTFDNESVPEPIATPKMEVIPCHSESIESVDVEPSQRATSNFTGVMTPAQPSDQQREGNNPQVLDKKVYRSLDVNSAGIPKKPIPAVSNTQSATTRSESPSDVSSMTAVEFLEELRSGHPFSDITSPEEREKRIFYQLEKMYQSQDGETEKEYRIEQMKKEAPNEIEKDMISYKRLSNVYKMGMHNIFFCPVWAAACDQKKTGYIMYPPKARLICLREALADISKSYNELLQKQKLTKLQTEKIKKLQSQLREVLRMVATPVALGLDALHSPVPHRRPMFYHRDLCIDNIFLPCDQSEDVGEDVGYGEAKIKLSRHTRCSHDPEYSDTSMSVQTHRIAEEYFHHPDPLKVASHSGNLYTKRHDWYSFGVVLLEMICEMVKILQPVSASSIRFEKVIGDEKIEFYSKCVEEVMKYVEDHVDGPAKRQFLFYLGMARDCLAMDKLNEGFVMQHKITNDEDTDKEYKPEAKKAKVITEMYYFEYGISPQTARLLVFYDDSRSPDYRLLADRIRDRLSPGGTKVSVEETCQSCMLKTSVKISTRSYRRGVDRRAGGEDIKGEDYKCGDKCNRFYCRSCYTNGERFFCPISKHGTASSRIGHDSSYALIFCGDDFNAQNEADKDVFVADCNHLYNTITHSMICEVPKDNVVFVPLHKTCDKYGATPTDRFEAALDEMGTLLHRRVRYGDRVETVEKCNKDQDYTLMVFYSGHGGNNDPNPPNGTWAPTKDGNLFTYQYIWEKLNQLTQCENTKCSDSKGLFLCFLDHCYTKQPGLNKADEPDCGPGMDRAYIRTQSHTEAFIKGNTSEITHWFCMFLRSTFNGESPNKDMPRCGDECKVCPGMIEHINNKCHNAYLDSQCLKKHVDHLNKYKFDSKVTMGDTPDHIVLAHYHPEGIFFKIFPLLDGEEDTDGSIRGFNEVEIAFTSEINRENIAKRITEMLPQDQGNPSICLLTNYGGSDSTGYSLVWDDEIKHILELSSSTYKKMPISAKLLYYHVVERDQPIRIRLAMKDEQEIEIYDELHLDLNGCDMSLLINECQEDPKGLPKSRLPNILVQVLHKLFHLHYKHRCDQEGFSRQSSGGPVEVTSREDRQASRDPVTDGLPSTTATTPDDGSPSAGGQPQSTNDYKIVIKTEPGQNQGVDNMSLSEYGGMIRFTVKADGDARITLQQNAAGGENSRDAYEVILGGDNNSKIVIRTEIDGKTLIGSTATVEGLLDRDEGRSFWITWGKVRVPPIRSEFTIRVGSGTDVSTYPLIKYSDPSPLKISSMAVATEGYSGDWVIENIPEKIHSSFAGRLFDQPNYDYKLSTSYTEWRTVEENASRYLRDERERMFEVDDSSTISPYYKNAKQNNYIPAAPPPQSSTTDITVNVTY